MLMRQCPRCSSELSVNDKVCPRCGLPVDKMHFEEEETIEKLEKESKSSKLNAAQKKEKRRLAKQAKKEEKKRLKLEQSKSNTDFTKYLDDGKTRSRRKRDEKLNFELDENGEIDIDTADVELIGEEGLKEIEKQKQQTYSVKKARGDYREPKIKWWEIYKLADRAFARRKIKREVSKAAKVKPDFISKTKLLLLAIFLGWTGAHNFYAKNKKKGWVSLSFLLISMFSSFLSSWPPFKKVEMWFIGFTGFVVIAIWVADVINIIFNQFKYRIQIDKFISDMNIQTRAKLGEKYIDLELLHKPWPVRFKVWWQKKKRDYQEWKHDRRQRMIEKEKQKMAEKQENEAVEQEVAEFERKENLKLEEEKHLKNKQKNNETENKEEVKVIPKKKQAKISIKSNKNSKNKKK